MSTLDEPFSGLLVDASHGHGKRGGQHEASCFISTKVDLGDDVDIVICKAVAGIPAHMKECILKAGPVIRTSPQLISEQSPFTRMHTC